MKTFLARILVHDDVDVQHVVEQLVENTSGPGAPLGVVEVDVETGDYYEPIVTTFGSIVTRGEFASWNGEKIGDCESERTMCPSELPTPYRADPPGGAEQSHRANPRNPATANCASWLSSEQLERAHSRHVAAGRTHYDLVPCPCGNHDRRAYS